MYKEQKYFANRHVHWAAEIFPEKWTYIVIKRNRISADAGVGFVCSLTFIFVTFEWWVKLLILIIGVLWRLVLPRGIVAAYSHSLSKIPQRYWGNTEHYLIATHNQANCGRGFTIIHGMTRARFFRHPCSDTDVVPQVFTACCTIQRPAWYCDWFNMVLWCLAGRITTLIGPQIVKSHHNSWLIMN